MCAGFPCFVRSCVGGPSCSHFQISTVAHAQKHNLYIQHCPVKSLTASTPLSQEPPVAAAAAKPKELQARDAHLGTCPWRTPVRGFVLLCVPFCCICCLPCIRGWFLQPVNSSADLWGMQTCTHACIETCINRDGHIHMQIYMYRHEYRYK